MKKFNRVLAMLLALVTVLAVLPISALADTWLSVKTDKTTEENVTSTDITVSVDPKALLSYIKDGDIKGLLKGVSADGSLGDIMTKEELLAIIPEEKIIALAKSIIADIDAKALLACLDADKLLACVDTEGLKSLLEDMNLKSYVKDGAIDIVLKYVTEDQIKVAVQYIDTTKLVEKYSKELMNLALGLEQSTLLGLVSIDDAIKLDGVKFEDALNLDFFKTTVGYANLADNYVDDTALEQYFTDNEAYFEDILPEYVDAMNNVDVAKMIDDGKLVIRNLIVADVILVDELVAEYGYTNLADVTTVINKVVAGLNAGTILPADVLECLKVEYSVAVDTIIEKEGVDAIIAAIPGGYMTLIKFVDKSDYKDLIVALGVKDIAKNIIKNREITKIIDVVALLKAIPVREFVNKVQIKELIKVIYESGVAQKLLGMLDFNTYIVQAFGIYGSLSDTITEIKINGAAITTRIDTGVRGMTKLNPAGLLDGLTNLVPTLTELANIDESGKLFGATLEISYYASAAEDAEIKTKVINFNFVLESGVDLVRRAAAKLSVLISKIGTFGLSNGQLVANINIPSEFASVLRIALEKMADSADPAMNTLKDKILGVYAAYPDDFIAFAEGLTLEEIVAVLDAVDPALFGRVYNKALASRYAQVLLAYVERVTGWNDIANRLDAQNLIHTFANIPTFEAFVEKLEKVIGREITDRLPAKVNGYLDHTVYEVIDKLAEVFGYDFDIQNLLKNAAASTDPFAYLYNAVVDKVENAEAIYNCIKTNAIKVANRLLASRFGAVVADNCLMDFYAGNSKFVFAKSITFDAKVVVEKALMKVLNFVGDRVSAVGNREEKIAEYINEALDMILSDGSYVTTGFNVSVNVKNVYRATFVNQNGGVIISTLLPVGVELSKMVNAYANVADFEGWKDVANDKIIEEMPAWDVTLKATMKGTETPDDPTIPDDPTPEDPTTYIIQVIPQINGVVIEGVEPIIIEVVEGTIIGDNAEVLNKLNAAVDELRPKLNDTQEMFGCAYIAAPWDNDILYQAIEENKTIYVNYTLDKTSDANIKIDGLDGDFTFYIENGNFVIALNNNWNKAFSFVMNIDFLETLYDDLKLGLVFTTADGKAQTVALSNAMLGKLVTSAGESQTVALNYNPDAEKSAADFGIKDSTAQTFEFSFTYGENEANLGDFATGDVVITLPFENALNETNAVTNVFANEYKAENKVTAQVADKLVTFSAPHFSTFILVNQYKVTIAENFILEGNNITEAIKGRVDTTESIATGVANDAWYEAGAEFGPFQQDVGLTSGLVYSGSNVTGANYNSATGKYTVTGPVSVQHYAKVVDYKVYYYVNGVCVEDTTYTMFDYDSKAELANALFNITLDSEYVGNGWSWYGIADAQALESKLGKHDENGNPVDVYLFRVHEEQTTIAFAFSVAGQEKYTTSPYEIGMLNQNALANIKVQADSAVSGYKWMNGSKEITAYIESFAEFDALIKSALMSGNNKITFTGTVDNIIYNIFTNGNVNVQSQAKFGDTITFTVDAKDGYNVKVTVNGVVVEEYSFVMPASDVVIIVTYTAIADAEYDTIVVTIPANKVLKGAATDLANISEAPAGLVLSKMERNANGDLVLTYTYKVTGAQVNKQAFINAVLNNNTTANPEYATKYWIVNGVAYESELAACQAELPEGAKIVDWTQVSENVRLAVIEYTAPAGVSAWLIVCIVLFVLLLIALIALIYVLHVSDKIAASWLTKVCAAIVGAFFAFCMILAKATLKVLNFMGIKTEDILEELPEEEPVEDIPAVIIDTEAAVEEDATEEVVEEAIEEIAEEATEETAEEAVEEVAEEATEETAEEAVEEEEKKDE